MKSCRGFTLFLVGTCNARFLDTQELAVDKDSSDSAARFNFWQRIALGHVDSSDRRAERSRKQVHDYMERIMELDPNPDIPWRRISHKVRTDQLTRKMPHKVRIATVAVIVVVLCGILCYYSTAVKVVRNAEITSQECKMVEEESFQKEEPAEYEIVS